MSEVFAGLVGGLLALAGGFGVQWFAARHADRQEARHLTAQLMTALRAVEFRIDYARDTRSREEEVARAVQAIEFQNELTTIGHHLELLSDRARAKAIRLVVNAALRVFEASWDADRSDRLEPRLADLEAKSDDFERLVFTTDLD